MPPTEPSHSFTPVGEHDEKLLSNVHPSGWQNPEPEGRYHLVVVGAGTAGLVSAAGAAGLGASVALVERGLMGGDCLNVGCVPSKGVIAAARRWHAVRDGGRFGAPGHAGEGDFAAAMERMRRVRASISPHDSASRFRDLGIDVFLGEGRFVSRDAVEVAGARLEFRRAVIATGGRAAAPPIPGLESVPYLTNETVFSLTELPERLAVIGGGPIGCELAQSFARFGSRVTVFDIMPQVLPREDEDAAAVVERALIADGVTLALGSELEGVEARDGEKVITYQHEGATHQVTVDEVLVAVGRKPNLESLGLEAAGVEHTNKGVTVDERFRTSNPKVFACGDVASPFQFTHAADAQARAVISHAFFFGLGGAKSSDLVIPWCTYTQPEVAHVGLYEHEAKEKGIGVETVRVDLDGVDRALLDGEAEGFLKVHVEAGSDRILGATIVAAEAGDLIAELCLAITHDVGLKKIASTIHPYPTQAEVIKKAADAWNRTRLTDRTRKLLGLWFRLFG